MLKTAQRTIMKFLSLEKSMMLVFFILLVFGIYLYSQSKYSFLDNMSDGSKGSIPDMKNPSGSEQPSIKQTGAQYIPPPSVAYAMQPVTNPADLLPKDANSEWSALNQDFMKQGNIAMPDLLQAGYHIGLDTIGQTLRNANYQERSDPIIPKVEVGPWNQSTIQPDIGRVPIDVGYGCK